MARFVALLRGVNVGGHRKLAMADLRAMCGDLGLAGATTLLQSGNLVLDGGKRSPAALERLLESETAKRLKVETAFIVRSTSEWGEIVAANPFPGEAKSDPSHLMVVAFKEPPDPAAFRSLQRAVTGPERTALHGREIYVTYPEGSGSSSLEKIAEWRRLSKLGTARNWNTVLKLAALVGR